MLSEIEDKVPAEHLSGLIEGLASMVPDQDEKLQGKLKTARKTAINPPKGAR